MPFIAGADFIHKRRVCVIGFLHAASWQKKTIPTITGRWCPGMNLAGRGKDVSLGFDFLQDVINDCHQEQAQEDIKKALGNPCRNRRGRGQADQDSG